MHIFDRSRNAVIFILFIFVFRVFLSTLIFNSGSSRAGLLSFPPGKESVSKIAWTPDSVAYFNTAKAIQKKGRFDQSVLSPSPEIFRTPGYPVFLAGIFSALGDDLYNIVFIQIFLSSLSIFCLYRLALLFWKKQKIAWLVMVIYSLDPWTFEHTLYIGTETLFTFFLIILTWLLMRILRSERASLLSYLSAGILMGALTFIRPIGYFLYIPVGLILLTGVFQNKVLSTKRKQIVGVAVFLLVYLLMVNAWRIRNELKGGFSDFSVVSTQHLYTYHLAAVSAEINKTGFTEEHKKS